jgi:hypothetical protein
MELNFWTRRLRELYDKALVLYRSGNEDLSSYFTADETEFLASIGLKPINVFDFAEDVAEAGEPDWDTFLLIAAARRDYFLYEQNGAQNKSETSADELPEPDAELGGMRWLPRIIKKAECFLHGGLCHEIMYCCGGDRRFLKAYNLHPADFLRAVWAAKGSGREVLEFVRKHES